MSMTAEQRRAYIETSRRSQPIAELLRKAKKAQRRGWRRTYSGAEGADLSLAQHWQQSERWRPRFNQTFRITFCNLCWKFAPAVGEEVQHLVRCSANPVDDGPYPGWAAAGRPGHLAGAQP